MHVSVNLPFTVTTPAQPATRPLQRLREWQGMAEGAYSANTLRAQKGDGAIFHVFCEGAASRFCRRIRQPSAPSSSMKWLDLAKLGFSP
jgi:hypothetical protein